MAVERLNLHTVGFLFGDLETMTEHRRGPLGTFFLVSVPSEWMEGLRHIFMVTARHVIVGQPHLEARMRGVDGGIHQWDVSDNWTTLVRADWDWAIRPFAGKPPDLMPMAIPREQALTEEYPVKLGGRVFVIGLLHSDSAPTLARDVIPVVRTGNVAGTARSDIGWLDPVTGQRWTAPEVHLVDVRSRGGFSGSPVFVQFALPGPSVYPLPDQWQDDIRQSPQGVDPDDLGDLHFVTAFWGVFAGHADESGIGAVVPASLILETVDSDRARDYMKYVAEEMIRKAADDEQLAEAIRNGRIGV